jgi:hypothetical protein
MASGHVNRIYRPNTWQHDQACDVKKALANPESRPHVARKGHADCVAQCPLSGAKRKSYALIELFRF